eukprot:XP_002257684.1 hypothetical protein, conserved in Plasmodium species [Plasmodium knowlesi strain H]
MTWGVSSYNIMHSQDVPPKYYTHDEEEKKNCTIIGSKKRSPREQECCKFTLDNTYLVICTACIAPNEEHHLENQKHFPSAGRSLSSFGGAYDGSGDSLLSGGIPSVVKGSTCWLLSGDIDSSLDGSTYSSLCGGIDSPLNRSTYSSLSASIDSSLNRSTYSSLSAGIDSPLNRSTYSLCGGSITSLQSDATRDNPYLTVYYRIANSKKLKELVDYVSRRIMRNRICRKIMGKVKNIWKSKPIKVVRFVLPFLPLITMMMASVITLCMGLSIQAIFIAIFAPFAYPLIFISLRTDKK